MSSTVIFLALLFNANATYSAPILADKLLLDIEQDSYTQRDMEVILIIKGLLQNKPPILVNSSNWVSAKNEFLNFTKSFHESLAKGRIFPREGIVNKKVQEVFILARKYPSVMKRIKELDVSQQSLKSTVAMVLQTLTWLSFKNQHDSRGHEQASIIRWYQDTDTFQPIYPAPSSGISGTQRNGRP